MPVNWKTEEEARGTWCPEAAKTSMACAIGLESDDGVSLEGFSADPGTMCRASKCAMWVWAWNVGQLVRARDDEVHPGMERVEGYATEGKILFRCTEPLGGCGLRRLP